MATHSTETTDGTDQHGGDDTGSSAASTVRRRGRDGSLALLAGGALLARAARGRGRRVLQGALGAGLLALGLRQRRSSSGDGALVGDDGHVSADAAAALEQERVLQQDERNPRGTSGEPDVETQRDAGSVTFTEDHDESPHSEPELDEGSPHDPRIDEGQSADDGVEVELSEAAMADEESEAVGPTDEQAQPSSTEGTEPEPTPAEDESDAGADQPDDEDE